MDFRALWNISSTLTAKLLIQISRRAPAKLKQSKPNMMQDTSALSAGCTANILLWTAASCSSEQILNFSTVCRLRLQEFKATVEQFCNNREMLSTDRIVWKNECLPYHVNALLWRKYLCLVFGQVSGHTWDTEQLCAHSQHHTSFSYNGKQQGKKKYGVEIIGLCSVHYTERFLESRLICYCFAEHSIPVPPAMPFVWGTLGDLPALPAPGSSALPPLQLIAVLLLLAASRSFPFGAACTRAEAAAQSLTAVSDDAIFLLSASEIRRRWTLADLGTCSTFTSFDSYCSFNALVFQGSGMCL